MWVEWLRIVTLPVRKMTGDILTVFQMWYDKSKSEERKPDSFEKEPVSELGVEDEITDKKNSSAQSVHERHVKAADMMHRAFENIYKNTEPLEPDKKEESDVAEAVVTDNKLNSLSDELDDLLN